MGLERYVKFTCDENNCGFILSSKSLRDRNEFDQVIKAHEKGHTKPKSQKRIDRIESVCKHGPFIYQKMTIHGSGGRQFVRGVEAEFLYALINFNDDKLFEYIHNKFSEKYALELIERFELNDSEEDGS